MRFNDKEMAVILAKKIDKIIFSSNGQNIMSINLEDLLRKKIESDDDLKKQLLAQVLQSDD